MAKVTPPTGDGGVDIIHDRAQGRFLGQVKCYDFKKLIGTDVIQRVHSQMQRQGVEGGFVITTSGFQQSAIEYAREVNIDLYDGEKLVEMWLSMQGVESITRKVGVLFKLFKRTLHHDQRDSTAKNLPRRPLSHSVLFILNHNFHNKVFRRLNKSRRKWSPF